MNQKSEPHLIRALSLSALIIYGVGDILGAGIYALVGKIAGHAGPLTWLSFVIAMGIMFLTALSYSELGSRYPRSGGVSVYIQEAFNNKLLSTLAGFLLFTATLLSMSTVSQAFAGFIVALGVDLPNWASVLAFFIILFLINIRGIKQSSIANIISTTIEISGLLIVLVCGFWYLAKANHQPMVTTPENMPTMSDVFRGVALAFFAFTGFEDLVNVAEEIKQPEKNLPLAILFSLSIAGMIYLGVSWVATAIISGNELSQSVSPLLDVVKKSYPAMPISIFAIIAIFAVSNTTLLNYITASRLLYGMSEANLLPKFLQSVHRKYHTPYIAILVIFPLVLALGLTGSLSDLASSTSAIVLTVFSFSNIALIKIKLSERGKKINSSIFQISIYVPFFAVILNLSAMTFLPLHTIISAAMVVVVGLSIVLIATLFRIL